MNMRTRINMLAAVVIAVGGYALSAAPPARAAVLDPCEQMAAALDEAYNRCVNIGGTSFSYTASCGSGGYTISTSCRTGEDEVKNP